MPGYPGPTASLKAKHRRSGRAGTVWMAGAMLGEVISVQAEVEIEQVAVQIPGEWQDQFKPGAEARRGTFRFQDVDDRWRRMVWGFLDARRRGDRAKAAEFPEFDVILQIDDIGAPAVSRWALSGCSLYSYSMGFAQDEAILTRDVPFTFTADYPLDTFEYVDGGVTVHNG